MDTRILLLKLLVLLGVFQCQAVEWRVYKGSTNYVTVPFNKICGILPHIKPNKPCVFLAFGSSLSTTGPAVESIVSALVEARQYNVVLLDWSRESKVTNMGRSLRNASRNAIKIGCEVGRQLGRLVRCGLDAKKIYLIGHSLAGHLMGEAGRCALDNRVLVPRITGLDPPGKLFEGAAKFPALDKTCAFFVDVIHTDPLGYGARSSMGTVDIYPNFSPSGKKQPGCPVGEFKQLSPNDLCSHNRAVLLFIEGIRNPHSLTAANADSYSDWLRQRGHNYDVTYIGPLTDFSAIGNYYLRTNAQYPYSKGMAGQRPPKQ